MGVEQFGKVAPLVIKAVFAPKRRHGPKQWQLIASENNGDELKASSLQGRHVLVLFVHL